ncbi:hypothetical protein Ocin01_15599 [Orchesella cincta]|uniref:Uncharacterized protein n=1 Tax=Orchesella cincta TaxID=48709 RepID=A0A1D2MDZ5_ORCCI|nr:hypothetical protein Ocin01_15599 [Orchesella cincta]
MGRYLKKSGVLCFLVILNSALGVEHNLPEGVELVDPKDLGLDSQFDLNKLLGNVKALPIDTNGLSAALGKPGLKTQVLTVGFDGSEGLNLDDFELPQLKNDENGPLAMEAFKSFKNFLKNSSSSTPIEDVKVGEGTPFQVTPSAQPAGNKVVRLPNGKRRTMMKRRKVVRVNGTIVSTSPAPPAPPQQQAASSPQQGPKVIELDSSQIEKLIASGKIGPPKSITPGGPQVIELGQSDLDALLNGENGDEIKQILEGGDTLQNFDLSQLSGGARNSAPEPQQPPTPPQFSTTTYETTSNRVVESRPPLSVAQVVRSQVSSPIPTATSTTTTTSDVPSTSSQTSSVEESPSTVISTTPSTTTTTAELPTSVTPSKTSDGEIIYSYSSLNDNQNQNSNQNYNPPQNYQASVPLQFYSSHSNGQEQARGFKTPTFEFISAPPVSFSSSIIPNAPQQQQNQNQQQNQQQQQPQYFIQPQPQYQSQSSFISQASSQFITPEATTFRPSSTSENKREQQNPNQIVSAPQTSSNSQQLNSNSASSSQNPTSVSENIVPNSNSNYIQSLHKVPLPHNSVKLVTPSPQTIQAVLNQVPASFQPSLMPHHIVSSPVLDPFRLNSQGNFLRVQNTPPQNSPPQQQFRNTQLFSPSPSISVGGSRNPSQAPRAVPAQSTHFRFPTTSSILSSGGPNRFRTSESANPFFSAVRQPSSSTFGNLVLNSFVAGDGLNYRPSSRDDFNQPGI